MHALIALLKANSIFAKLGEEEISRLARVATARSFARGEFVAHYGEHWPYLMILRSGTITAVKLSPDGRTLGHLRLKRGDVFWSPALFDAGPLPASLEAKSASTVHIWHQDDILPALRMNAEALWEVCQSLVQRMRLASSYVEGLAFQPVAARLARLLLDQFTDGGEPSLSRELTLEEMGTMIGTTPVMVCKLLSRFAADGFISISRTQFSLLDRRKLEAVAEPR